ncbi:LytR/AlgR family response regulator transcription factor [Algoriphagus zhangzhouensis]|uniref:Two component transcriptional regulator, LytTR family n=1 Tax=Algoriphagus zhangzhouensis TaxID=1073327 RepID=A0A1M7ZEQ5_9BACT|nr:LytTR family DNA-binding domain-containing protein [Algoriphagus zhangzhouensis]TDY46071.1 LytTR family two component transcriptional regulator [Algoriphagus zhangzhouensis]SHO63322.1 two component transcriptional regulator, LytTR family [Algoriphagus zhangzhouensis]
MNCIIIEDQPPAQRILKKYIEDLGTLDLKGVFGDPLKAMVYLQENSVDLIFLDINLPKLSGISFLKSLSKKPQVILTTAYSEYALEGYELDVTDYLLKPFSFERFLKAVSKVRNSQNPEPIPQSLPLKKEHFIKIGYEHIRIAFEEILYLSADGDYCEIHLNDKKHLSSETLKKWIEMLEGWDFFRVHKSYVVNIHQIEKVSGNTLYLYNGTQLPIGRAFKEEFMERFLK